MRLLARGTIWFTVYLAVILFPLLVGWLRHPPAVEGRAFSLQFSAACGYVAWSVMSVEFALISRVGFFARAFGQDALLRFHRQMGLGVIGLILLHLVFVFKNAYPLAWLLPVADGEIQWGAVAAYTLLLLIALSLGRSRLGIPYGWWQVTHSLLATGAIFLSGVHILKLGSFVGALPMKELWAVYILLLIGLEFRFRLLKPLFMWRKPWQVVRNVTELGNSQTLVLKPIGHSGFVFQPGQFAWLNTGKTPFSKDQHPISFSSCAYDEPGCEVSFTIRALGDWSGKTVPKLPSGSRIWVDGPYGEFTPEQEQGPGYVLIAGGVGVTPFYSVCQTFAERGDCRPVVLFYASKNYESLTFREQFDCLQSRMNLKLIYVLQDPCPDWKGESGFVTGEVLIRHLPKQFKR